MISASLNSILRVCDVTELAKSFGPCGLRRTSWRLPLLLKYILLLGAMLMPTASWGQAGLRESLERLDRDQDGEIEPEEITPQARPYLERVARAGRLSLDRDNRIEEWQQAARLYYAINNGMADERVRPQDDRTVQPFGPDPDKPLVPEFGLAVVKYPYTQDDLDEADQTLRRSDRNEDGYLDRSEARRARWTHRDPFKEDYDNDDRLSRLELAQRYARRRMLSGASSELLQQAIRTGSGVRPSSRDDDDDRSRRWQRRGSRSYLASSVLDRFDLDRDGRLGASEVIGLGIPMGLADTDRNGELSRDELSALLEEMQAEAGDDSEGLPSWFYELDSNRDAQIAMAEFASEWSDEKVAEFDLLDINGDGFLTAYEAVQSKSIAGGTYRNSNAEVLPPRKTIISEIVVDEKYRIADLNLQLSITHSQVSSLDAYLTGPDGQRIELFSEVGGSDDNFNQTVFDDQASQPITKARGPFEGSYLPEAILKRQPSLSHFTGKSIEGVWQLVISGSRNERYGMLHSWGLIVTPLDDMLTPPEQ